MKRKILLLSAVLAAVAGLASCASSKEESTKESEPASTSESSETSASTKTHEHSFTVMNTEDAYLAGAATCTAPATYYYSCECGEKGTKTYESGEALGHDYGEYEVSDNPTFTETGLLKRTCSRGDAEDTYVLPALNETDYEKTETKKVTTTASGLDTYSITVGTQTFTFDSETNFVCEKTNTLGFADGVSDFSSYVGTDAYVVVRTAEELIDAILAAKGEYTSEWVYEPSTDEEQAICDEYWELEAKRQAGTITSDEKTRRTTLENQMKDWPGHLSQTVTKEGTVHVIEIAADLELGYNTISALELSAEQMAIVDDFSKKQAAVISGNTMYVSDIAGKYGVSQIKLEGISNLMIYSQNGSKITHAGFKLTSDKNIVIRNLTMDEIWQWEDSSLDSPSYVIGDYDVYGWAYMKIAFSSDVFIDHCTFGKSYDGQIDVSNPYWYTRQTAFRAPMGSPEKFSSSIGGVHISNCNFTAGSDDEDGYLYKMMASIEEEYQKYLTEGENYEVNAKTCKYYNFLRDSGATFDEILYGIAIPQKKGFLLGDSGDYFDYNIHLKVSFDCCLFTNIEDRVAKVRGGLVIMTNCILDTTTYCQAREQLYLKSIDNSKLQKANSKWKFAGVCQGLVCGLGGSEYLEGCIFKSVTNIAKNNDSGTPTAYYSDTTTTLNGTYCVVDSVYDPYGNTSTLYKYSTAGGTTTPWDMDTTTLKSVSKANFSWGYDFDAQPFSMTIYGALTPSRGSYKGLANQLATLKCGSICENGEYYNWLFNDYIM